MAISIREKYNKQLDKIEIDFYNGRRKATDTEIKNYIKENFDRINKNNLPEKYASYYGLVQGGKNRSKNAIRIQGEFVSDRFTEKLALQEVAKRKGYKSVQQLFKKEPQYYEAVKKIYSETGAPYSFFSENIFDEIDRHNGKIFVNEEEVTKNQAIEKVNFIDRLLFRKYNIFPIKYNVRYIKGSQLHIYLPSENFIRTRDIDEFLEDQEDIELIGSPNKQLNDSERKKELFKKSGNRKKYWKLTVRFKKTKRVKEVYINTKLQCERYAKRFDKRKFTTTLEKYDGE